MKIDHKIVKLIGCALFLGISLTGCSHKDGQNAAPDTLKAQQIAVMGSPPPPSAMAEIRRHQAADAANAQQGSINAAKEAAINAQSKPK